MAERIMTVELPDPLSYTEGNGDETIVVPIQKMIDRLQAALNACPAEYREFAMLRIEAFGDYAHAYLDTYYELPESTSSATSAPSATTE